jgi:hypothetical protein
MDLANIIALVSQHNADPSTAPDIDDSPEVVETVIGRNLPRAKRGMSAADVVKAVTSTSTGDGSQSAPIHSGPKPVVVAQPETPKLDAKAFILAIRKAKTRDDSIAAIVGYTGLAWHVVSCDFGNQDREARAKASRELSGKPIVLGPSREERKAAERSMTGFIHGMPVPQQRIVLDLRARAQSAAEARDKATTDQDRAMHQAVLTAANKALAELGF